VKPLAKADACIKCSLCVTACPVYRVDLEFPGPKALGPDWWRRYEEAKVPAMPGVGSCTFCKACEAACPVDVPVAHLIAQHKSIEQKPLIKRLRDLVLSHPERLHVPAALIKLGKPFAPLLEMNPKTAWPTPSPVNLNKAGKQATSADNQVAVFVDCYTREFDSASLAAAIAVLSAMGYSPEVIGKQAICCGAAAQAAGRVAQAEKMAKKAHDVVSHELGNVVAVITLNATCDDTIRSEWASAFGLPQAAPVVSFAEFLDEHRDRVPDPVPPADSIIVHSTCRSRAARGDGALLELSELMGFTKISSLGLDCCGAAGSYAFKREHSAVSNKLVQRAGRYPGRLLVTDSGTCGIHIAEQTGANVVSPAELVAMCIGSEVDL
jgi:glycerol-3-phosphate dehydrogenase subunit C